MSWEYVELKNICQIKSGKRLPKGTGFSDIKTEFPYIRARDIKNGTINENELVYLSEDVQKKIQKYIVNTGDIVITIVGASVGDVGFVKDSCNGFNLTENAVRLTEFDSRVNPKYLLYMLNSKKYWELMQQISGGSAQPKLGIYKLESVPLELPSTEIQNRIADIISSYDSLIENNQKQIKLLEEAAQRLYKEWFVDLHFPGYEDVKIVDGVPEGWSYKRVDDFGEVITGQTPPTSKTEYYGGNIPFVTIPDMHGNVFPLVTEKTLTKAGADTQKNKYLPVNSVIVSCIATVGLVSIATEPSQTNQQINSVILYDDNDLYFFYESMKKIKTLLDGIGSNGATMTNVNKTKFSNIHVLYPTEDVVKRYNEFCKPIFDNILALSKEILVSKKARDHLLPKLMSGEIEV